jgi:hypothetical protein
LITRKRVLEVLTALEADDRVWVAGSAAIMPEKADDIDLWVMKKSELKAEVFEPSIWTDLQIAAEAPGYEGSTIPGITKRLQCVVPGIEGFGDGFTIQIMFTSFKSPMDLLEHFDVSCHAWARNKDGFLVASPKATVPGSPIVRLKPPTENPYADYIFCPDDCETCDSVKEKIAAWQATHLSEDLTDKRIQEFTLRYADTTLDMCWMPA